MVAMRSNDSRPGIGIEHGVPKEKMCPVPRSSVAPRVGRVGDKVGLQSFEACAKRRTPFRGDPGRTLEAAFVRIRSRRMYPASSVSTRKIDSFTHLPALRP